MIHYPLIHVFSRIDVTEAQFSVIGIYLISGFFGVSVWSLKVSSAYFPPCALFNPFQWFIPGSSPGLSAENASSVVQCLRSRAGLPYELLHHFHWGRRGQTWLHCCCESLPLKIAVFGTLFIFLYFKNNMTMMRCSELCILVTFY